jgi:cell division protein FtsZ
MSNDMNSDLIQFEENGAVSEESQVSPEAFENEPALDAPIEFEQKELPNIIKVLGVGGGGGNAVNYMFKQGIKGVDFVVCNTDAQALHNSPVPIKVKLGNRKLGAGSKPEVGKQAALDSVDEIKEALSGETEMLFITAGMGGGTGTGAAPIIAEAAKEMGILTVGIVTIPFEWEGQKRLNLAEKGIEELKHHVDTLIVISNTKLREVYGNLSLTDAFSKADDILKTAAKGIAELITVPGYVNVDFEDVKTIMTENESGKAIMSSAQAEGEERATKAVQEALSSPLLDDNDIVGASDILLHIITGEKELMMDEVEEITTYIQSQAGNSANLIWGNGTDSSLGDALSVTIIATGFDKKKKINLINKPDDRVVVNIDDPEPVFVKPEQPAEKEPEQETTTMNEPTLITKEEVTEKEKDDIMFAPSNENTTPTSQDKVVHKLFDKDTAQKTEIPSEETLVNEIKEEEIKPVNEVQKVEEETHTKETPTPKVMPEVKHANERIRKLQGLSSFSNASLSEMEKVPAYQRRNVELDDTVPSTDENVSRYSLSSDDNNNPSLNKGNSFLHDNVD